MRNKKIHGCNWSCLLRFLILNTVSFIKQFALDFSISSVTIFTDMYFLLLLCFQKLAIRILCNGMAPSKIDDTKQAKIVKFTESMWKLTYFLTVVLWALTIIHYEPWSRDNKEYFRGWPDHELKWVTILLVWILTLIHTLLWPLTILHLSTKW